MLKPFFYSTETILGTPMICRLVDAGAATKQLTYQTKLRSCFIRVLVPSLPFDPVFTSQQSGPQYPPSSSWLMEAASSLLPWLHQSCCHGFSSSLLSWHQHLRQHPENKVQCLFSSTLKHWPWIVQLLFQPVFSPACPLASHLCLMSFCRFPGNTFKAC